MQSRFLDYLFLKLKHTKKDAKDAPSLTDHGDINFFLISSSPPHTEKNSGRGDKNLVGAVVKVNLCELEEEVREGR